MDSDQRLAVVSNRPGDLQVSIDGTATEILDCENVAGALPTLFILALPARTTADPAAEVAAWRAQTRALVEVYQAFEGPSIILNIASMQEGAASALSVINDSLLLESPVEKIDISLVNEDPIWSLMLENLIKTDLETLRVLEEATALCIPVDGQEGLELENSARRAQRAIASLGSSNVSSKKLDELVSENELLLLQLHQLQEELEKHFLAAQEQEKSASVSAVATLAASEQSAESQAKNEEVRQENELLLLQLHQVQEELERYYLQFSEMQVYAALDSPAEQVKSIQPLRSGEVRKFTKHLFDRTYYDQQVGERHFPLLHYRLAGWKSGFDPHPLFDTEYYLSQIGLTLDTIDMPPLLHYLRIGTRLNVSPHPEIDTRWYKSQYPDVASSPIPMAIHFIAHGWQEGRRPNRDFDCDWYLGEYRDVAEAGMNPLAHYVLHGKAEGRRRNAAEG